MKIYLLCLFLYLVLFPSIANATAIKSNAIDINTIILFISTALVFFMQAGFACLESGFARVKNTLNVIMKNYSDMAFGIIIYWMVGFGFMFGNNPSGFIGLSDFFFDGSSSTSYATFLYQAMFATTAATIVSGAVAERMTYRSYVFISILIVSLIYPIAGSWIWNPTGWLHQLGFIDFAGSTAVHSLGAWVALAGISVLGARIGRFSRKGAVHDIPGHNLILVALGAFILWFGWFGFNAGNAINGVNDLGKILTNTFLSASASVVSTLSIMLLSKQPILMTRTINSGLAGLVAMTAGAATMEPIFALITGSIASIIMITGEKVLLKLRLDDVVGAIPVHGFAGAWGTLAAGLFYHTDLFNLKRIFIQLIGIGTIFIWGFCLSWLCFQLIKKLLGLRQKPIYEQRGLDYSEHHEKAYSGLQQELFKEVK